MFTATEFPERKCRAVSVSCLRRRSAIRPFIKVGLDLMKSLRVTGRDFSSVLRIDYCTCFVYFFPARQVTA